MIETFNLTDLKRIESRLSAPLDLELEAYERSRYRYFNVGGKVRKLPVPHREGPGSGYTGTIMETLYANAAAGNNLATFTAEATMYAATQPQAILPANFFDPSYGPGVKTVRVTARGIFSTTATPTFTLGFRPDSVTGTPILGSSLAITGRSTVSNLPWELEFDIICQSATFASAHNEAVLVTLGFVSGVSTGTDGFTNASAIGTQTPTTAATLTTADASHYLVPTITCGTSNASNKWQMLQFVVFGCN